MLVQRRGKIWRITKQLERKMIKQKTFFYRFYLRAALFLHYKWEMTIWAPRMLFPDKRLFWKISIRFACLQWYMDKLMLIVTENHKIYGHTFQITNYMANKLFEFQLNKSNHLKIVKIILIVGRPNKQVKYSLNRCIN